MAVLHTQRTVTQFACKDSILSLQTTLQGGHVGGQYNRIFSPIIYMKMEVSSQRREMLLFLTTNMAAVT